MKKVIALFLLCFFTLISYGQEFNITGKLVDSDSKEPLGAATVYLETLRDSTLVTYTITNSKGVFSLEGKTAAEKLRLSISFVGYRTIEKIIDITSEEKNVGEISMDVARASLDEVVLKSRAPITFKKDTLEFNVSSFKAKKDATIEDLLRELPGVEVDEEGKIKVNGKEVNKILVNGKPFFGDDPTIATRNLTKEIIEKIQVTDTKTKSEAFSGEKGDVENKTINLTIKEENNKGVFGRVAAGGGTDKRYEFAGLFNYFDNDRRLSFLGGGNNTNSPSFSFGEIREMFDGNRNMNFRGDGGFTVGGRSFGGGQGIVTSKSAGTSYADVISKGVDISADYFYSGSNSEDKSVTLRENILPDRRYFTNSTAENNNNSENHSANIGFDVKVDSTLLLNIRPSISASNSKDRYQASTLSTSEEGVLTNSSEQFSQTETTGRNFSNNVDITKRFGADGAFVRFSIATEIRNTQTDDYLQSETLIFGDNPSTESRNQFTDAEKDFNSYFGSFTYRLPLISKKLFLDFKYSYRNDITDNVEGIFDFNSVTGTYSDFNVSLSTDYRFNNVRTTPGLGVSFQTEKYDINFGSGYVFRTLQSRDMLRPQFDLNRDFEALEMYINGNYRFSPKSRVSIGYNLSNKPPFLLQLQPNPNVQDPLNSIVGNPNLLPTDDHSLYASFNNYDYQKGTGFYFYTNVNKSDNDIVSKTSVDDNNVRTTTYANVDGNYSGNIHMGLNKSAKIDSLRSLKFNASFNANLNRNISFNNDQQYAVDNNTLTPGAGLTFDWKKVMQLRVRYSIGFSNSSYEDDIFEKQKFQNHNVSLFSALYLPKHFEWSNDVKFNYNPDITPGFEKSAWFWNATLAYSFMKENATVSAKVYDLLNQNTNARRSATQNYIQDSQSTVLQQYFMLSLSYKFNSLGSKGERGRNSNHGMH